MHANDCSQPPSVWLRLLICSPPPCELASAMVASTGASDGGVATVAAADSEVMRHRSTVVIY